MVYGCLEGVFAQGQVYVLVSRVTDPQFFALARPPAFFVAALCACSPGPPNVNTHQVGIPPADLLDDVVSALREAGRDLDVCLQQAISVTGEWLLAPGTAPVRERLSPKRVAEHLIPVRLRSLEARLLIFRCPK